MRTVTVEIRFPADSYHELAGRLASLPTEERTELESSPRRHSIVSEYVLQNYILSRKNLAEDLSLGTTDVEISETGELVPRRSA